MVDFITKPIHPDRLMQSIATLLPHLPQRIQSERAESKQLSATQGADILQNPPPPQKLPISCKKILIVDDEPTNLLISSELLSETGAEIIEASSGKIALALCEKMAFDCILMDMQMPILDGIETTQLIRTNTMNQDTLIIAMTASNLQSDIDRCLDAGMNGFIGKPIEPETFVDTLSQSIIQHGK